MKKVVYDEIRNKKTLYKRIYLLFNLIQTTVLILILFAVFLLTSINYSQIEHIYNLLKFILSIISILTIVIILIQYRERFKDYSIKAENYKEFKHIYNTVPITFKLNKKDEYIKRLIRKLKENGYKAMNTKSNNNIISFRKTYINPLLLQFISKKFLIISSEEINLEYIKNKVGYELRKNMIKYNILKARHIYICIISEKFSDDLIEYFKYDYKYRDEFLTYIIPIGIDLSSGNVYFKKRTKFMPFYNQFNFTIYRILGKNTKVIINKILIHYISIIMLWTSIITLLVYLNKTISKHIWPNKYIIIGMFVIIISSIIVSLRDVTLNKR